MRLRRYDAVNDFTPVTLWSEQPMVLEARKDLAANTIPEFSALLKANGAKMQFGSAGAGSTTHLACSLLNAVAGGGAFVTFPALLLAGVPPVAANATSTVALFPGQVTSARQSRRVGKVIGMAWVPASLATDGASITITDLGVGQHTVVVMYDRLSNDPNYAG